MDAAQQRKRLHRLRRRNVNTRLGCVSTTHTLLLGVGVGGWRGIVDAAQQRQWLHGLWGTVIQWRWGMSYIIYVVAVYTRS